MTRSKTRLVVQFLALGATIVLSGCSTGARLTREFSGVAQSGRRFDLYRVQTCWGRTMMSDQMRLTWYPIDQPDDVSSARIAEWPTSTQTCDAFDVRSSDDRIWFVSGPDHVAFAAADFACAVAWPPGQPLPAWATPIGGVTVWDTRERR